MGYAEGLHHVIERSNVLAAPTVCLANFFQSHATSYKVNLIVMHLFRAAMMVGMMVGMMCIPSMPMAAGMAICLVGSVVYRLTVERKCAYKFAIPSFFGATAFLLALPAIIGMINGVAFTSVASGFGACSSLIPLALYGTYVVLTVSYDVDKDLGLLPTHKPEEGSCCQGECAATEDKKKDKIAPDHTTAVQSHSPCLSLLTQLF